MMDCRLAMKKNLESLNVAALDGQRVLVRVDFDVPMDYKNLTIKDDSKIREALPTIMYLMKHGARVILASHLGRPVGLTRKKYSLKSLVATLSRLLKTRVRMASDCVGEQAMRLVDEIPRGGVLLLENLKFHAEEMNAEVGFSKKLACLADLFVNDAFGIAHAPYTSIAGVPYYLKPAVAGILMAKELHNFIGVVAEPQRPFVAIVGGSRLSDKMCVIESLLEKVDVLLLGGGIIFPFYQAKGISVGSSLMLSYKFDLVRVKSLIEKAKLKKVTLLLPDDVVIADSFGARARRKVVEASKIHDDWMGLDIGPIAINSFGEALDTAKTVCWNGPVGVFEDDRFAAGTMGIAEKLAKLTGKGVTTVIAGGHTVAAVEKMGLANKMTYVSTGRGASVEFLKGGDLPGVVALDNCDDV